MLVVEQFFSDKPHFFFLV